MTCFGHPYHIHRRQPSHCQDEQYTLHCSDFFLLITRQCKTSILKSEVQRGIFRYKGTRRKMQCFHSVCCCLPKLLQKNGFPCQRHFWFIAAIIYTWTAMQLELTRATVFSYQPLFSGLHMVPYSQCSPLFPFCSAHFWHQTDLSSHQLSTPERQENNCYWSLQSDMQSRRQWHPISK